MATNKPKIPNSPRAQQITRTQFKGEMFMSNYPPPEMMAHYAEVDPDFPNRLLKMAENEGNHRRHMDSKLVKAAIFLDSLGLIVAFLSVLVILYTGFLFMSKGYGQEGAWIIGTVAVALAIAFITRGKKGSNHKK